MSGASGIFPPEAGRSSSGFRRRVRDRYGVRSTSPFMRRNREGDQRHWHAHVLTTTRKAEARASAQTRILDDQKPDPCRSGVAGGLG